jgi:hypothetical protein
MEEDERTGTGRAPPGRIEELGQWASPSPIRSSQVIKRSQLSLVVWLRPPNQTKYIIALSAAVRADPGPDRDLDSGNRIPPHLTAYVCRV